MKKRSILFVDDDANYLELVEMLVAPTGVAAYFARSGEEAVELLKKGSFAAMVTDLHMPGMDGGELALIARELCPGIDIVMVSGTISSEVMELAAKTRISVVLSKPVEAEQIMEIARGAKSSGTNVCWTAG